MNTSVAFTQYLTESPSNIHFSRLESMTQRKLNNQYLPYITCDFGCSQLIHLDILSKSTESDQIIAKFLKMDAPITAPATYTNL